MSKPNFTRGRPTIESDVDGRPKIEKHYDALLEKLIEKHEERDPAKIKKEEDDKS